jgi:tRNA (guanine-N7-)-methyltransferase
MGKNKLRKFGEMAEIDFVFQYPFSRLQQEGFEMRGKWSRDFFHNDNPIVLELGCGKGEYTVGLAQRYPDKNFIGLDIKGARMWTGACQARDAKMSNVAFIRTSIELIASFFTPGEVSEIWITFPDPQMKKVRKRLTSTRFMELYRKVLRDGGLVHLKSDSPFLYSYTKAMVELNGLPKVADTADLYDDAAFKDDPILQIRTHYEKQWLQRGLTIKYLSFNLPAEGELQEPQEDFERDTYRSYSRGYIQMPQLLNDQPED